jgi:hypothetical protein
MGFNGDTEVTEGFKTFEALSPRPEKRSRDEAGLPVSRLGCAGWFLSYLLAI